jgi:predicted DNA-binding transcriptional regulator AlpA
MAAAQATLKPKLRKAARRVAHQQVARTAQLRALGSGKPHPEFVANVATNRAERERTEQISVGRALLGADNKLKPERFLSWRDLFERGVISSKTQARRLWERGEFPKPVHLSERVIAFRESEIDAWAAARTHNPQPAHGVAAQSQQLAAHKRTRGGGMN